MKLLRWRGLFLIFLLVALPASSMALPSQYCVTISQGIDWEEVKMKRGEPTYLSTRVSNSSAQGDYCEPGVYEVTLEMEAGNVEIGDIFDWEVEPNNFELGNGDDQRVLVTLTPKVENGTHNVLIIALRRNPGEGGTQIFQKTKARLTAVIGEELDSEYAEVPFWTIRKDCPGGYVVRKGDECPRICESGKLAGDDGKCPEDEEAVQEDGAGEGGAGSAGISFEMVVAITAVLAAVAIGISAFFYIQRLKQQMRRGGL